MKDRIHRIEIFSIFDHAGIEGHLEKMARKGWLLEGIRGPLWTYRRMAPEGLRFAVTYDPAGSAFAPGPTEEQLAFREFCRYDGWDFAAAHGPMQVFYSREEDPVPLETDEALRADKLRRAAKRCGIPGWLCLLALGLWHVGIHLIQLDQDPELFLSSNSWLLFTFVWLMGALLAAGELAGYWMGRPASWWKRGCLVVLGTGLLWWLGAFPWALPRVDWVMGTAKLLWLGFLPLTAGGIRGFLRSRKASAGANAAVTLAGTLVLGLMLGAALLSGVSRLDWMGAFDPRVEIYTAQGGDPSALERGELLRAWHDELPLTVEDLVGMPMEGYSYRMEESNTLFLRRYYVIQQPREDTERFWDPPEPLYITDNLGKPNLSYTVLEPKLDFLYEVFKQAQWDLYGTIDPAIVSRSYVSVDPAPWGAEKAYELRLPEESTASGNYPYFLCYNGRLVKLSLDWETTKDQKMLIGEKLGQ